MPERKSFLLRIDRDTLDAVQRWANDDLRSLNGQIEFLLRRALQQNARAPKGSTSAGATRDAANDATNDDANNAANKATNNDVAGEAVDNDASPGMPDDSNISE